jgi:hypothetical protein
MNANLLPFLREKLITLCGRALRRCRMAGQIGFIDRRPHSTAETTSTKLKKCGGAYLAQRHLTKLLGTRKFVDPALTGEVHSSARRNLYRRRIEEQEADFRSGILAFWLVLYGQTLGFTESYAGKLLGDVAATDPPNGEPRRAL